MMLTILGGGGLEEARGGYIGGGRAEMDLGVHLKFFPSDSKAGPLKIFRGALQDFFTSEKRNQSVWSAGLQIDQAMKIHI